MVKYYSTCSECGRHIKPLESERTEEEIDDLGTTLIVHHIYGKKPVTIWNVYRSKRLVKTYCGMRCLKKQFKLKKVLLLRKFADLIPYPKEKMIWVSKKYPDTEYTVIPIKIQ